MATYLIGDIQGCYAPLQALLEKIAFDPASDRLWPCGDLVNRGGHSLQVLKLLHSLGPAVSATLGNHDLHLLACFERFPDKRSGNFEFNAVFNDPDCETLLDWLCMQPLATFSEEHRMLRVHAGVIPAWDAQTAVARSQEISDVLQSPDRGEFLRRIYGNRPRRWRDDRSGWKRLRLIANILTRLRFCDAENRTLLEASGPPDSQPEPYLPWYKHKHRQTRDVVVAFGHWAALGLKIKKRYIAMDSGCVWGGKLSALRLEDRKLIQVGCDGYR
jgi:bis(5'-nucleosyl)-tetraphosphatase (symmetrical)